MGSRRRHIGNMGKRKETSEDDTRESSSTSPKKKHKRKHKKHKKKKDHGPEGYDEERKKEKNKEKSKSREKEKDGNKGGGRAVKLKIKLRGETVATTQMAKIVPVKLKGPVISSGEEDEPVEEDNFQQTWQGNEKEEPEVTEKERGDSDEQEEQKWLDALERGELDDFGRVKQDKDVSMMTARQRAMLGHEIEGENQLLELPTEPRRKSEDSEEAQKRRKQRAKKRKQQMQKKIEENKTQTVKKLLDREATRSRKEEEKARRKKQEVPHIRYISNQNGFALSFSKGLEFPLQVQLPHKPPEPRSTCAAQGCMNLKKYSCSSNKLPVCSMECYKKVNLLQTAVV